MHNFVMTSAFKSLRELVRRKIGLVRVAAFLISIAGIAAVGLAVAFSTSMAEKKWVIFIMGGTLALTPFVVARALQEAIDDPR